MLSTLTLFQFATILFVASFIGIGKAGLPGIGMLSIPIFASILGSRASTGFLLPLLLAADSVAVVHYYRQTKWTYLLRLSPWVLVGVIVGSIAGQIADAQTFKYLLSSVIFIGVSIMLVKDILKIKPEFFTQYWFTVSMGFMAGFSSMIGNAAGPVMSLYLISVSLPKEEFIATRAWFFFIVNLVKIPFHVFLWKTISIQTLTDNLYFLPSIWIGMLIGFAVLKKIPENIFRIIVLVAIALSAVVLVAS